MEYSIKNTKEELIKMLDEQKHLAKAVDAKDKEISDIKKIKEEEIRRLKQNQEEEKKRLNDVIKSFEGSVKKEEIDNFISKVTKENEKLVKICNAYIEAYRDTLKLQKINLDMAIAHEAILSEKLN